MDVAAAVAPAVVCKLGFKKSQVAVVVGVQILLSSGLDGSSVAGFG